MLAPQYECQRRIHLTIIANKEFQVMSGALMMRDIHRFLRIHIGHGVFYTEGE
jgi:hypothetical protein